MECSNGKCNRRPGYCDETVACAGKCRNNECGPECLGDNECTREQFCSGGACAARPECGENSLTATCSDDKECRGGTCVQKVAQCTGDPVYFDFDRANIKRDQRAKFNAIAECLRDPNAAAVQLAGHCDERGTAEYNLALGQRRADASAGYLKNLGAPAGKVSTVSYGEERPAASGRNERVWSKNRRVEFNPQ